MNKFSKITGLAVSLILALSAGYFWGGGHMATDKMTAEEGSESFVEYKKSATRELISEGKYSCCLKKPCSYCLKKRECECLKDVMEGKHPCGECMGEILEGHGNKFLAPYFASALAEEVGSNHLGELKKIISEKYGIAPEKQIY